MLARHGSDRDLVKPPVHEGLADCRQGDGERELAERSHAEAPCREQEDRQQEDGAAGRCGREDEVTT